MRVSTTRMQRYLSKANERRMMSSVDREFFVASHKEDFIEEEISSVSIDFFFSSLVVDIYSMNHSLKNKTEILIMLDLIMKTPFHSYLSLREKEERKKTMFCLKRRLYNHHNSYSDVIHQ